MSPKAERQKALLDVIAKSAVATQTEIKERLKQRGIEADQATLSRDIKEMGIFRMRAEDGGFRYSTVEAASPSLRMRATLVVARLARQVEVSGNLVVVKTGPGESNSVGLAIDRLGWPEVIGTVAGDDTLLVVIREGTAARRVVKRIMDLKTGK